jgi:phage shock protein A
MEDTLVEVRSAAAKCIADRKEHRRHIDYLEREAAEWTRRAELAVRREREDLARAALSEKQGIADKIEQLNGEMALLEQQMTKFNDDITKLQAKLADAKKRQRSIVLRHKTATTQLAARKHIHDDRIDEMLFRFEHAERKIDRIESEGEVLDVGRRKTLADEIAGLEDDDRVEEALAKLKAEVKGAPKSKPAASKES